MVLPRASQGRPWATVVRQLLPRGRLLAMAEQEGRRRGCTRIALNTLEIQARGFYEKQGYETAATLDCDRPGVTRYLMSKRL